MKIKNNLDRYMMEKKKFLTVYAVLDSLTQKKLQLVQNILTENNLIGTQTTNIPFHISLGSFPIDMQSELIAKIKTVCNDCSTFPIDLAKISHFNNKIVFAQPKTNDYLTYLQKIFKGNYADNYDWHPHITLFCGKRRASIKAKKLIKTNFSPFTANIISIQMGEFFPTKIIIDQPLQDN